MVSKFRDFLGEGIPCNKHPTISKLVLFILESLSCEVILIKEREQNEERL